MHRLADAFERAASARAEPRDFIDLAELTQRFTLHDLIALAAEKDPGLDLAVLEEFMDRVQVLPRADFELDDRSHEQLLATVRSWQTQVRQLRGPTPCPDPVCAEPGRRTFLGGHCAVSAQTETALAAGASSTARG